MNKDGWDGISNEGSGYAVDVDWTGGRRLTIEGYGLVIEGWGL